MKEKKLPEKIANTKHMYFMLNIFRNPDVQDKFEWKPSSVKVPLYLELKGPSDFVYHQNKTVHQERCALWF